MIKITLDFYELGVLFIINLQVVHKKLTIISLFFTKYDFFTLCLYQVLTKLLVCQKKQFTLCVPCVKIILFANKLTRRRDIQ